MYARSDGSVKDGIESHAYGFTRGTLIGEVWAGATITPGENDEMASLRAEQGGTIGILLILYAIQIYAKMDTAPK